MKKRNILIVGGASALLLLSILFGAFFAGPLLASANSGQAASSTATTTNPYCTQYLADLAHRLNVSVSTLQQDKLSARQDIINQMVKDGKLTQSQANALNQKLSSHQACTGKDHGDSRFITRQFLQKYRPVMVGDIAKGLNLTSTQLTSDLQAGQSLSTIATAQHISATQLNTIVNSAVQDALKQAVSAKDLTQAQADAYTQFLQKHPQFLTHIVNTHMNHVKK